jgi:hypothetical protein
MRGFRHKLEKHEDVFSAVATITLIAIENGKPLLEVDYHQA